MKISTQIIIGLTLMCAYVQAQHSHSGGQTDTHKPSGKKQKEMHVHQAPAKFQEQLNELFVSSLNLKDAFVDSDVSKVLASAAEVKSSVAKVDLTLLKDESLMDWMGFMKKLNESLDMIANSEDIAVQRKSFALFSDALYKSIKTLGIGGRPAYYDYCPMADNNKGAYWLSNEKEIKNPYFGESMLTCGSVKEIITH